MRSRFRSSNSSVTAGLYKPSGALPIVGSYINRSRSMTDWTDKKIIAETGRLPDTPLDQLNLTSYSPSLGSYNRYTSEFFSGWPLSTAWPWSEPPNISSWNKLAYTQHAATLLARTNPFRYEVSVPVMVSELTELAHLASVATRSFFSLFSSGYLGFNFGILPFYNDMKALASITKALEIRIREFNRLVEVGYVRRKQTIATDSYSQDFAESAIFSGMGIVIYATRRYTWDQKISGSCTWRIRKDAVLPIDGLNDFNSALKFALDLDQVILSKQQGIDLSTIWEAIPFSWLVDYFINVGDSLKAIEESELIYPMDISLTRECTLKMEAIPVPRDWWGNRKLSATRGYREWKLKKRVIIGDDPSLRQLLSFGFLTKSQALNIIALIGVMKR